MNREIHFGKSTQIFYELSPFHVRTFTVAGRYYKTLIHYWLASMYSEPEMKDMISGIYDVQKVLQICIKRGFKDFNQVQPKYILIGLQALLSQHRDIKDILLSTGNHELIYDGIGYLAENNRYGRILEKVRDLLNESK